MDVSILKGKILKDVVLTKDICDKDDTVEFIVSDNERYLMYHDQDCCESVDINDICGELNDLIGSEIIEAEEVTSNNKNNLDGSETEYPDSFTWTFYKFRTARGCVTIRWYGESNGCYSESVNFKRIEGI